MTKPYCSKRHGMLTGAVGGIMNFLNCRYCGTSNDKHSWYCKNCYRCLDCQRIIKSKINDPAVVSIKGLPKFEHTKNLVRTYCLKEGSEYIREKRNEEFTTIVKGKELVERVLGGELDLLISDNS